MESSKETIKLKMCILCEKKEREDNFFLNERYCEKCWRNNNNEFLHDYELNFNYDLFYLKYLEEKPADWGEVDIDASLRKLENELKRDKKLLPVYQKDAELGQEVEEMKNNITRLEKEISELKKFQTYQAYQIQK